MPKILIVDDSEVDRLIVRRLLMDSDLEFVNAEDGDEGLQHLQQSTFDLVISDVRMPRMNGLEFLTAAKELRPGLPVVIVTSRGTEKIAAEALERGAAGFVVKDHLGRELVREVERQLELLESVKRDGARRSERRAEKQYSFDLPTDPDLIPDVIRLIADAALRSGLPEGEKMRLAVALEEGLRNAVVHGNLEVSSHLREGLNQDYDQEILRKLVLEPFRYRRLRVSADLAGSELAVTIKDDGPGFDVSSLPDPTDPENLLRASGRGVLLMQSFMDRVSYNERGNELTLVKLLGKPGPTEHELQELGAASVETQLQPA